MWFVYLCICWTQGMMNTRPPAIMRGGERQKPGRDQRPRWASQGEFKHLLLHDKNKFNKLPSQIKFWFMFVFRTTDPLKKISLLWRSLGHQLKVLEHFVCLDVTAITCALMKGNSYVLVWCYSFLSCLDFNKAVQGIILPDTTIASLGPQV